MVWRLQWLVCLALLYVISCSFRQQSKIISFQRGYLDGCRERTPARSRGRVLAQFARQCQEGSRECGTCEWVWPDQAVCSELSNYRDLEVTRALLITSFCPCACFGSVSCDLCPHVSLRTIKINRQPTMQDLAVFSRGEPCLQPALQL